MMKAAAIFVRMLMFLSQVMLLTGSSRLKGGCHHPGEELKEVKTPYAKIA
jgi:hypothetical protein